MQHKVDFFGNRESITEQPLSERAYQSLRAAIIRAEIMPDEKLKIEALQSRFGFSNTPLREAFNRLAGERLVQVDERRGFRVAPVSLRDYQDLTEYRLVVERGALAAAIRNGGDDWEGSVVAAYRRLQALESRQESDAPLAQDRSQWLEYHKGFHIALLSGGNSQRLVEACSAVFDEAERYRHLANKRQVRSRHSGDEHAQIMEAALARDVDLATALLRNHIQKSTDHVVSSLSGMAEAEATSLRQSEA